MSQPEHVRPTRAEIDLDVLAKNLAIVRRAAGTAELFGVVKADAYGHGLTPVGRRLAEEGIDGLCVALVEEGLALRQARVACPILVLNGIYGGAHREVLEAGLIPVVYDLEDVERFAAAARAMAAPVDVHLKIDTGMSRLGVRLPGLDRFLDGLAGLEHVRVAGLMTHLASAEDDASEDTARQLSVFAQARARVEARGHRPTRIHAANGAGTLLRAETRMTMVRAGVALYGVRPRPDVDVDLEPVMRVVTSVARVETIEAGARVGYNGTWTAPVESRVATLGMGYGDGLMRHLGNRGEVLVGGVRCPIVGNVSMDLTGVDVTRLARCERGDEAVIVGRQAGALLRAEEVAERAGTIGYEVLTSIAPRVPRVYVSR